MPLALVEELRGRDLSIDPIVSLSSERIIYGRILDCSIDCGLQAKYYSKLAGRELISIFVPVI